MKKLIPIFLVLVLFLCFNVSAIKINEFESNPAGGSSGNEWVEIYNDECQAINISGWEFYDGLSSPKKIYTIANETILNSGEYYVVELSSSKLNNAGDFVTLYDNSGTKIDETEELSEISSSTKTWQLCGSEWTFIEQTKGQENDCSPSDPPTNETNQTTPTNFTNNSGQDDDEEPAQEEGEENSEQLISFFQETSPNNPKQITQIKLTNNNSEIKDTKPLKNKNYSPYYLLIFCFLLAFLYLLKEQSKKKTKKNEFR